jgi:hypothetical protein
LLFDCFDCSNNFIETRIDKRTQLNALWSYTAIIFHRKGDHFTLNKLRHKHKSFDRLCHFLLLLLNFIVSSAVSFKTGENSSRYCTVFSRWLRSEYQPRTDFSLRIMVVRSYGPGIHHGFTSLHSNNRF